VTDAMLDMNVFSRSMKCWVVATCLIILFGSCRSNKTTEPEGKKRKIWWINLFSVVRSYLWKKWNQPSFFSTLGKSV